MPITSAPTTSGRLLTLLSLLQARRDWPGPVLRDRLHVSERTLRRDIDRLRELGYPIGATKGPDGGYRLQAGSRLPPLLFDDEQAVALTIALQTAVNSGADIGEAAARALTTLRQVMPTRLRHHVDNIEITAGGADLADRADVAVLLGVGEAIRAAEELRFDYRSATGEAGDGQPPRRIQPHHLVARGSRWYLVGWDPGRDDWRVYRADRMTLRTPRGRRFTPREIPGGVDPFLSARFKGSTGGDTWPCVGDVVLHCGIAEVVPHVGDGTVEALGPDRCRLRLGAWSWPALAATVARFDADLEVVGPPELRTAFAALSTRAARAAAGHSAH